MIRIGSAAVEAAPVPRNWKGPNVLFPIALAAVSLVLQGPSQMPASPVKRIEVQPASRTITAGDSVRLTVRALDAEGAPLPNAVL